MAQTPIGYLVHCRGGAKYLQMQEPKLCDWVLSYEPVVLAAQPSPQELLADALDAGATFAQMMNAWAVAHPLTVAQQALVDYARECYHREGDLEFDDLTIVSDPDGESEIDGDYVLCWKWVDRQ